MNPEMNKGEKLKLKQDKCVPRRVSHKGDRMNIIFYLKLYVLTVPIFFAIDIIWLGFVAKKFYRNHLGFILSPDVNWSAAISFYLMYIAGILIFAALDYVRLSPLLFKRSLFHLLPDNVLNLLGKAMKGEELYEFTKPATLILAFATIFFFPFPIFFAAALIATLGDGAASIMGKRFGKKNFPKNSPKTLIGYLSGFLASFGPL